MEKYRTEGVIVKAAAFQDYDRILSVFTPEEGLIKLFVKGAFSSKNGRGSTTDPLNHIEIVFTKGRSEIYKCHEISVLDHHLGLRRDLATLDAACDMLQAVSLTQMPGKSASLLYELLTTYLQKLPSAANPLSISASFRLKTMRYEGIYGLHPQEPRQCSICECLLDDCFMSERALFCRGHAPENSLLFNPQELMILEALAYCRDFSLLADIEIPAELTAKIVQLFNVA